MISTRMHGVIDYVVGALLIIVGGFLYQRETAAGLVPLALGVSTILYSLLTAYEHGVWRVIPMKGHLLLDALSGVFLAASPWIFDFDEVIWWPHVLVGVMELGAVAMTARVSPVERSGGADGGRPSAA